MGFNIVPSNCPKFVACCATLGVELEEASKGVSNTYSKGVKYDPDEPGCINYYLSKSSGLNPAAIAKVWKSPEKELQVAAEIRGRVRSCTSPDEWESVIDNLEQVSTTAAIASISLFASGKLTVNNSYVSAEETLAAEILNKMPEKMRLNRRAPNSAFADELDKFWEPAMYAWVKAWIANYLELRHIWKGASKSIKIEHPDHRFPIIIPQGKDARMLLRRWTS